MTLPAWMAYAVLVSLPVAGATWATATMLRRSGKPERWVWMAGVGVAVALPVLALATGWARGGAAGDAGEGAVALLPALTVVAPTAVRVPTLGVATWLTAAAATAWALMSLALAGWWFRSLWLLKGEARAWRSVRIDDTEVRVSRDVGPAVVGFVRPRIVVPEWVTRLPAEQVRLIVRHEREHVRAGDPHLLGAALLARVLFPWHPGVWFLTGGLRQGMELDCDRRVLERDVDVSSYGETLLAVCGGPRPPRALQAAAFVEPVRFLKRRLMIMTSQTKALGRAGLVMVAVVAVLGLAGACGVPILEPDADAEAAATDAAALQEAVSQAAEPEPAPRAAEPTFTPFTVAPKIRNVDEIVAAMKERYPAELREDGTGGTVVLWFYIDEEGTVRDVRVNKSSGHPALDSAALEVASVYRFEPALNRDKKVPVWVSFPITFKVR